MAVDNNHIVVITDGEPAEIERAPPPAALDEAPSERASLRHRNAGAAATHSTDDQSAKPKEQSAAPPADKIEPSKPPAAKYKPGTKTVFNCNAHIYTAQSCCDLVHYRTGAALVGLVESSIVLGVSCFIIYRAVKGMSSTAEIATVASFTAFVLLSTASLFFGLYTYRPLPVFINLCAQYALIGKAVLLTVLAVVSMSGGLSWAQTIFTFLFGQNNLTHIIRILGPIWPFCLAVIFDFYAALAMWAMIVVRGAHDFLLDKEYFEANGHLYLDRLNEMRAKAAGESNESIEMSATSSSNSSAGVDNKAVVVGDEQQTNNDVETACAATTVHRF